MDEGSKEIIRQKQSTSKKPQAKSDKIWKKPNKRVAGQKDIRTLIKSKKNELLKYSKDFDLICKQSGIDVDPEQLQLAIALSKSLQDNISTEDNGTNIEKPLSCNQRKNKIRTTLQEYGFQTKNPPTKKVKKYRKHYKLLLVSDTEKQQKIADKFAQVLISNICVPKRNVECLFKSIYIDAYLYSLATNVEYEFIKDDEIYHIHNLVPKTEHITHNFKDWSEIPGRPVSPTHERLDYKFKTIECTQEELDNILSGTIDVAQDIIKRICTSISLKTIQTESISITETVINQEISGVLCDNKSINDKLISTKFDVNSTITQSMAKPINRSCSPDLFDDEVTIIMDNSDVIKAITDVVPEKTMTVKENDFMDLTNCIGNMNSNYIDSKNIVCFSQGSNKTRSNSNDFMDLTECIPACSQKNTNNLASIGNTRNEKPKEGCKDEKDPNSNNLNQGIANNEKSLDDTIIMIEDDYNNIETCNYNNVTNSACNQSAIIDLAKDLYKSPSALYSTDNVTDSVVNLEENIEFNDSNYLAKSGRHNNSDKDSHATISNSAKGEEYLDTIDLTQPTDFRDHLPQVNIDPVISNVTREIPVELDNTSNDAVAHVRNYDSDKIKNTNKVKLDEESKKSEEFEGMDLTQSSNSEDILQEDLLETSSNKVQDVNEIGKDKEDRSKICDDFAEIDLTQSCNAQLFVQEDSFVDDPNRVVYMNGIEKDKDEKSKSCENFEELDLTQSSNSEDILQEVDHEPTSNIKSSDNTIIFNNEYHSSQISLNTKDNLQNDIPISFDIDTDREFDNLVENVSARKPYISHTSDLHDTICSIPYPKLSDSCSVENKSNYEDVDLTQDYNCSNLQLSESKTLRFKSSNMDNDDHSIWHVIDDQSSGIKVDKENHEIFKTKKGYEKSETNKDIVTKFLETDKNQTKRVINVYIDNEIDNAGSDSYKNTHIRNNDKNINQFENLLEIDENDNQNSDIDLTQQSGCSDTPCSPRNFEGVEELGKVNNISIDYDDMYGNTNFTKGCEMTPVELSINEGEENDANSSKGEGISVSSQHSQVFKLSDNEFNYSIHQHIQDNESIELNQDKFDIGGISVIDDFLNRKSLATRNKLRCSCSSNYEPSSSENTVKSCLPVLENTENILSNDLSKESKSYEDVKIVKISTPLKARSENNIFIAKTPKHNDYIIKTDEVTPMPNYENMTSPERNEALDKFGIKPLKRKRAIQILTHIYNQTHPYMEVISNDEYSSPSKIRRKNNVESFPRRVVASQFDTVTTKNFTELSVNELETLESNSQHKSQHRNKTSKNTQKSPKKTFNNENILYEETSLTPDIRNIECSSEDLVFQKREKAKVHSCRVPLHIAFHNYVYSRKALREAILRYEPINIDDIHKGLVAVGYRYNPKDLLKFMDRKCITVKTADNSKRNKKP